MVQVHRRSSTVAYNSDTASLNVQHSTMSPVLPFDIITVIIDIIGEGKDIDLLKELALVSHSFLHICREHLFASVELYSSSYLDESPKKAFVKLLESRLDVVKYIRKLTYRVNSTHIYNDYDRLLSAALLNSYPRFSRLNCLAINASNMDWNTLDSSLTSALIHLMHLPTINHIDLTYIQNFPLISLTLSVNLYRLDIFHLPVTLLEEDSLEIKAGMVPKIREFHTSWSSQLTRKLLQAQRRDGQPAFNFIDLRRLSMTFNRFRDEGNIRYLLQNAKLLDKLHLEVFHGTSLAGILSLGARSLKVLDLLVPLRDEENSIILGGICEELEALAGYSLLETLSIEVRVSFNDTEDFIGSIIQNMENVLVKPADGWSALRQVSFKLRLAPFLGSRILCDALQSLPDTYLSHLSKLESVAFNYSAFVVYLNSTL